MLKINLKLKSKANWIEEKKEKENEWKPKKKKEDN